MALYEIERKIVDKKVSKSKESKQTKYDYEELDSLNLKNLQKFIILSFS